MTQTNNLDSLTWKTTKGRAMLPAFFGDRLYHVAGIVNITPDSFSDGGEFFDTERAVAQALRLVKDGADSIDFGAESTRPGSSPLTPEEEQKRLLPVLRSFSAELKARDWETVIAVDTYHAATAQAVLESGLATVINDVSGGILEPDILAVVAHYGCGYVVGHCPYPPAVMQKNIHYSDVAADVLNYFKERMDAVEKAGIDLNKIALDPCIGFAKNREHNLTLIREARRFLQFGLPIYYGISRKSFLQDYATQSIVDKDRATQVVTAYLAEQGVGIHRVHDVAAACRTLHLTVALHE